ncbi:hypothetical protein PT974_04758 [Cladobotryum mycophilum]|uniref:Uncharacterized protein n=1 Tax=Cladobotryum mycophilum TaxID=491253 RepID=A0ABR0SQ30_9HYPO
MTVAFVNRMLAKDLRCCGRAIVKNGNNVDEDGAWNKRPEEKTRRRRFSQGMHVHPKDQIARAEINETSTTSSRGSQFDELETHQRSLGGKAVSIREKFKFMPVW